METERLQDLAYFWLCVARIEKGGEVPVQQTVIRYDEYCCNRFRN